MDTSQVASLKDELKVAISTRDAAIAVEAKARVEVGRLAEEVVALTRQTDAAEGLRNAVDGLNADVERLMQERDTAIAMNSRTRLALAVAQSEAATPHKDLAQQTVQTPEPAKADCKIRDEDGIEILGECYPLDAITLSLRGKQMTDASPLSGLTSLRRLFLEDTQIADASPLSGLTLLERLDLKGTLIVDLGPLRTLTNLHYLLTPDGRVVGPARDSPKSRNAVADYIAAHSK